MIVVLSVQYSEKKQHAFALLVNIQLFNAQRVCCMHGSNFGTFTFWQHVRHVCSTRVVPFLGSWWWRRLSLLQCT